MIPFEPLPQAIRGKLASRVTGEAQRSGNWFAEKRIAKCVENQREGAFRNVVIFVSDRQLSNKVAKRVEDWIECIAVAGKDHPGAERARALFAEYIEDLVDDIARVRLTNTGSLNRFSNACRHQVRD
jgi:hypothetical protein